MFLIEKKKKYFIHLWNALNNISQDTRIYPPKKNIFNAFLLTPLLNIKVVILGQDPYCRFGQAHGLSFSVPNSVTIPPSLKNIFIELKNNFLVNNINMRGCLESWAKQGVFLLNSILTVSHACPRSHQGLGWEIFTDEVIKLISYVRTGIVFILWGSYASQKYKFINENKHFVLKSSHPSPLSCYRSFFGCRHFLKTNMILKYQNKQPIDWFKDM
ncbi:uracil-DNA glycosylase [Buchnera aphidicola]|uniref:uracil-DNA glycosylase n=1 Tax=Buchnera aphidicola TaxID=9 RepID=UPI0012AC49BE|nr:uracil-DNA glycosylase [Buchnera aphidicola]